MILICLLLVGVEMDPGPTSRATRPTNATGARIITVGVEINSGPTSRATRSINATCAVCARIITVLNARSVVNKVVEIHLTMEDEWLDVLAVSETWIPLDAPDAISSNIAPPGFHIINAPRRDG